MVENKFSLEEMIQLIRKVDNWETDIDFEDKRYFFGDMGDAYIKVIYNGFSSSKIEVRAVDNCVELAEYTGREVMPIFEEIYEKYKEQQKPKEKAEEIKRAQIKEKVAKRLRKNYLN